MYRQNVVGKKSREGVLSDEIGTIRHHILYKANLQYVASAADGKYLRLKLSYSGATPQVVLRNFLCGGVGFE